MDPITKNQGYDCNYYSKTNVTSSTFTAGVPDVIITFSTQTIMLLNEGSGVIEYSFNGNTVHGELDPTLPSKGLTFDNRVVAFIWFRVKTGSSSSTVRVDAWAVR